MSWISENYEKATLGLVLVASFSLIYLGWTELNHVSEDFGSSPIGLGANDSSIKSNDLVIKINSSFRNPRVWMQGGNQERALNLFTGVSLFVNKNKLDTPVDLVVGQPVHPPIPNVWWLDHRIDPSYANSPSKDADEDGFTNIEEYRANTEPNNKSSHPPLIEKLLFIREESAHWVLRPGFESGDGKFTFEYAQGRTANRVGAIKPIANGEIFFDTEPAKGRFKLLSSEKRKERDELLQTDVETTFIKIEDQKANKKGKIYEIPAMFRKKEAVKFTQSDRTAVFCLEALGYSNNEFKVEENTPFSLPPGDKITPYKVTKITSTSVTIEITSPSVGVKIHEIQKK